VTLNFSKNSNKEQLIEAELYVLVQHSVIDLIWYFNKMDILICVIRLILYVQIPRSDDRPECIAITITINKI